MQRVPKQSTTHQQANDAAPPAAIPVTEGAVTLAMSQALIPLGLRAEEEALQQEVTALAGARCARHDGAPDIVRWGQQAGSIRSLSTGVRRSRGECTEECGPRPFDLRRG